MQTGSKVENSSVNVAVICVDWGMVCVCVCVCLQVYVCVCECECVLHKYVCELLVWQWSVFGCGYLCRTLCFYWLIKSYARIQGDPECTASCVCCWLSVCVAVSVCVCVCVCFRWHRVGRDQTRKRV